MIRSLPPDLLPQTVEQKGKHKRCQATHRKTTTSHHPTHTKTANTSTERFFPQFYCYSVKLDYLHIKIINSYFISQNLPSPSGYELCHSHFTSLVHFRFFFKSGPSKTNSKLLPKSQAENFFFLVLLWLGFSFFCVMSWAKRTFLFLSKASREQWKIKTYTTWLKKRD